jgi:hypothetical protein
MASSSKKFQKNKISQPIDDEKEEPIPFLVYDSNTRSNLKNNLIIFIFIL